ncbi:MAG: 16S rRNA (uracil(1498)-N(3))-methyltransferase [Halioglobus sp.]|nr:16S rRNA (uracil(1498)-N(3))-methyltransferase [Halioglobus sp.]
MNLILFTDSDRLESSKIVLRGRRLQHLRLVHHASTGDRLRVGEIDGLIGEGVILEINDEFASLAISLHQAPPEKLALRLVLALPRPKMLRRILRTIAELGVPELHLINSYRVEKSYWQSPVLKQDTVRDYLLQGLEQARDTQVPLVYQHRAFKPFVEDHLPAMIKGRHALLAHPGGQSVCPRHIDGNTLLIIGPEGGFIPYELNKVESAGCEVVSLGPRILRVETAVTSLIGRLF